MAKKLVLNLEILTRKGNVERALITKYWEEEIINNILQSDGELTHRKEKGVERRAPMVHQVSKALGVPKTFKIPRNHHRFQDPSTFQTTDELIVRKLLIYLTRPTHNLPWDKVEENGNCLARSSSNL